MATNFLGLKDNYNTLRFVTQLDQGARHADGTVREVGGAANVDADRVALSRDWER
jgi:hypothetical protein